MDVTDTYTKCSNWNVFVYFTVVDFTSVYRYGTMTNLAHTISIINKTLSFSWQCDEMISPCVTVAFVNRKYLIWNLNHTSRPVPWYPVLTNYVLRLASYFFRWLFSKRSFTTIFFLSTTWLIDLMTSNTLPVSLRAGINCYILWWTSMSCIYDVMVHRF